MRTLCLLRAAALAAVAAATVSCSDTTLTPEEPEHCGPGYVCDAPNPDYVRLRFEPRFLALAPGQKRSVRLVVDPDFDVETPVRFATSDDGVVAAPATASVSYGHPTVAFTLTGGDIGSSIVHAAVTTKDQTIEAELPVEVMSADLPSCSADPATAEPLSPGNTLSGKGDLAAASIALPAGADMPASPAVTWTVSAFSTSIECAADIVPTGHVALGPAITFGPIRAAFPRDMHMSIPINPARLPEAARWRHLRLAYSGPKFKEPRAIFVTDPRIEKVGDVWRLSFAAPRLGTYQAVVADDAGTTSHLRRLTHRALIGVSMGGSGAAQFGMRNHHLFDVVAAMGGPVDWTWLMDHLEHNHLAGFKPIAPGTQLADIQLERTTCDSDADCAMGERCMGKTSPETSNKPGRCTALPSTDEPYEHASTFDTWWYEINEIGNGGEFTRTDMTQLLRDISSQFGNPLGYNPLSTLLPAGVDPTDPSVVGDSGNCALFVKPYDDPKHPDWEQQQSALANSCPIERCSHTQVLKNYYDDEYNPDGTFDVITFCDGSPRDPEQSPYASTWEPDPVGCIYGDATNPCINNRPVEVGLAVDYNGNGKRDDLEPVIRAGHEPWRDWGTDSTPSELEPGYGLDNLDPSGDDYDPQYNPNGTEGDQRWQPGEPYDDDGLDGVANTKTSPYDFGEGDGEFTVAPGLQRFWDLDARSIVRQWSDAPQTPLDDDALARLDVWTDGGIRDLFNFAITARHFTGNFAARGRDAAMFSEFSQMPGLDATNPEGFAPQDIVWEDLQGVVMQRYGVEDPDEDQLDFGTGMHVGTIAEITRRLQSALYFIGSRWRDAPHAQTEDTNDKPAPGTEQCVIDGNCTFNFTSTFGRTGPVAVTLPPGYGHADLQDERYPVIYMLHGYGMTPEDLQAAIVFLKNWMNGNTDSQYSRLSKAILVYVDGRCRWNENMPEALRAECTRGNFYVDSARPDGPQIDAWFLELMDHIDANFRTMGESQIDWPE